MEAPSVRPRGIEGRPRYAQVGEGQRRRLEHEGLSQSRGGRPHCHSLMGDRQRRPARPGHVLLVVSNPPWWEVLTWARANDPRWCTAEMCLTAAEIRGKREGDEPLAGRNDAL